MQEVWHYVVVGFAFGFGFAAGYALFNGILSLFGRGSAPPLRH
jgi:hypothetical protein